MRWRIRQKKGELSTAVEKKNRSLSAIVTGRNLKEGLCGSDSIFVTRNEGFNGI